MTPSDTSSNARNLGAILRRRKMLIALSVVVTAAVSVTVSASQTPQYRATAKLQVLKTPQLLVGSSAQPASSDSNFDPATSKSLADLKVVSDSASKELGGKPTGDEIRSSVTVDPDSQSGLVLVSAEDTDARRSAQVATAFASNFAAYLKREDRATYNDTAALVRDRLAQLSRDGGGSTAEASQLRRQLNDLESSEALQNGGLKLAERASVPDAAFSPRPMRDMAVGLIGGLIIGVALALAADAMDRRLRSDDEFTEILRQPILAHIPQSDSIGSQTRRNGALGSRDLEAFRLLRASLRYVQGNRDVKRLLVTSSAAGEGKSTIAWNLAMVAARGRSRVLLIEADLRRPQLGRRYLAEANGNGLSEVLSGQAQPEDVLIDYSAWADPTKIDVDFGELSVLLAGHTPPNPVELLEGTAMSRTLDRLSTGYDLVIIDAPPPSIVADPIALMSKVDGVLIVGRVNYTDRRALANLRDQLDSVGARPLGLVINGGSGTNSDYY